MMRHSQKVHTGHHDSAVHKNGTVCPFFFVDAVPCIATLYPQDATCAHLKHVLSRKDTLLTKQQTVVEPLRIADAGRGVRHVFVRDLVITCKIGIYDHEKAAPQRVRFNLDLAVDDHCSALDDDYSKVVCYEQIVKKVRGIAADGHVNLVETLAERVANICLQDPRVHSTRVRVEKLDVFEDTSSVGVEIERFAPQS
jgi:dihydroneopterin aldolase